jgi:hypothetical protein
MKIFGLKKKLNIERKKKSEKSKIQAIGTDLQFNMLLLFYQEETNH